MGIITVYFKMIFDDLRKHLGALVGHLTINNYKNTQSMPIQ
jgi:hypothetical protein